MLSEVPFGPTREWLLIDFELLKFLLKQRLVGFEVGDIPYFDSDDAIAWFIDMLKGSTRYLEYGTGGSTYVAARLGVDFIAVDSDLYFLRSVRKKIQKDGFARPVGQTYHHADIGLTGFWGYPLRHWNASAARLERFRRYSDPPPECFEGGLLPDLVLVDGRFRVACVLKALRMLQNSRGWAIVVDDYVGRPQYHVIADYAEIDRHVAGRIAVLKAIKATSQEQLENTIRRYETFPD